jgi:ribonuclease D
MSPLRVRSSAGEKSPPRRKAPSSKNASPASWFQRVLRSLLPGFLRKSPEPPQNPLASPHAFSRNRPPLERKEIHATEHPAARRGPRKNSSPQRSTVSPGIPGETSHPMIQTAEELHQTAELLRGHERIAVDTEADSLHCYFDKLCLMQITVPGRNLLVDPLADLSLEPLFSAFEGKTLIIHSADYDLRLMRRLGYAGPTRLFDTMIAARLCGALEFGLAALLHSHFGIVLAKASQKANWALRPLPREMLEYAINDTAHLLNLADIQESRLRELGRWEWFEQSCERAIRSAFTQKEKDPDTLWRISGYSDLTPRGTAILRALWTWRDQEAQAVDRPAFHILNNDLLLEFSRLLDQGHPVDPRHLRGPRRERFFAAAQTARGLEESEWPKIIRKPRLRTTPQQDALFKELKKIRDEAAQKLQLDPTLIAPKATLEQLSRKESAAYENLLPWQSELLKLR